MDSEHKLEKITKGKQVPKEGDLFRFKINRYDGFFVYGRVIKKGINTSEPLFKKALLVYIYAEISKDGNIDTNKLSKERLLMPPQLVNELGWKEGYWETIENEPLSSEYVYTEHFFERRNGSIVTLSGDEVTAAVPKGVPVGRYGLGNYNSIEMRICESLSIST